jgi:hypothetical protein
MSPLCVYSVVPGTTMMFNEVKRIVLLKGRERETGGETPYSLDDYIFSLEARGGMPDPYSGQYRTVPAEMEFLNSIFWRGFWA